jgi:hypothetical protein
LSEELEHMRASQAPIRDATESNFRHLAKFAKG